MAIAQSQLQSRTSRLVYPKTQYPHSRLQSTCNTRLSANQDHYYRSEVQSKNIQGYRSSYGVSETIKYQSSYDSRSLEYLHKFNFNAIQMLNVILYPKKTSYKSVYKSLGRKTILIGTKH